MIAISLDKMVMTAMEMDWHTRNTDTNESQFKREDYSRSRVCVLSNMCKHIGSFGNFYTYYTVLGIKALFLQPDEVYGGITKSILYNVILFVTCLMSRRG